MDHVNKCHKPWCKSILPENATQKHCSPCQTRDRENQRAARARRKTAETPQEKTGQKRARNNEDENERYKGRRRTSDSTSQEEDDDSEDDPFGDYDNKVR